MGSLFDSDGDRHFRSDGLARQESWRKKLENAWIAMLVVASWKHEKVFLESVARVGDSVVASFSPAKGLHHVAVETMWSNGTAYDALRPVVAPLVPDEAEAEVIMLRLLAR